MHKIKFPLQRYVLNNLQLSSTPYKLECHRLPLAEYFYLKTDGMEIFICYLMYVLQNTFTVKHSFMFSSSFYYQCN